MPVVTKPIIYSLGPGHLSSTQTIMKQQSFKMAIIAISIILFSLILKSCKKNDNANNLLSTRDSIIKESNFDLSALRDSIALHPELKSVIIPMNEKVPASFYDTAGNIITGKTKAVPITLSVEQCSFLAPQDYPATETISSIAQNYDCNNGYSYTVTWTISMPVVAELVSPFSSTAFSGGGVKVTNIFGTNTYLNTTIAPTITYLGDDPSTSNENKLYSVVYTTPFIPFSDFAASQAAVLRFSILIYTDCLYSAYVQTSWSSGTLSSPTSTSNPCNRIDPIASIGSDELIGYWNIIDVGGCPAPPDDNMPDRQQVQISYAGSSSSSLTPIGSALLNWHAIRPQFITGSQNCTTTPGTSCTVSSPTSAELTAGTIGVADVYLLPRWDLYNTTAPAIPSPLPSSSTAADHGYYYFRYRDWMLSGCTGPWSTPTSAYYY